MFYVVLETVLEFLLEMALDSASTNGKRRLFPCHHFALRVTTTASLSVIKPECLFTAGCGQPGSYLG